jgi:hypothetical protein
MARFIDPSGKTAEAVRVRLQRMFPRFNVHAEPQDYGHATGFALAEGKSFTTRRFGVQVVGFTDVQHDARAIGGKFLRAAYPQGWAQP